MSSQSCGCGCSGGTKLIFACSGAADVGEIADKAARKLTREGVGRMFCMAGLGGRISGILKTSEAADSILAIDGCPLNCVKSSLEQAGFNTFKHLRLADLGLEKGKSPATEENVNKAAARAKELICS
ncbi:MAG: putative zinc-binding protein [Solirubrobacterales bacterium]